MLKLYQILSILFIMQVCTNPLFAQQGDNTAQMPIQMAIPSSARLNLSGSNLHFSIVEGKGAEQRFSPSIIEKIWLNYSAVVEANSTNTVCASLSSGNLPAEVALKLKIGPDAGAGFGQVGVPVDSVILSTYPQAIVTNIGSCFTGQGDKKGHLLTYSWELLPNYDPDILKKEDFTNIYVGITYTIVTDE